MQFYFQERKLSHTPSAKVTNNVSDSTTIVEPLGVSLDGSDPLSSFAKLTYDPLSKIAADEVSIQYLFIQIIPYNIHCLKIKYKSSKGYAVFLCANYKE